MAGHRWKYSFDMRQYHCVSLPFGGVESYQWCVGCGVVVTDKELCESGYPKTKISQGGYAEGLYLNILASGKGRDPIEFGSYEAWKLRK